MKCKNNIPDVSEIIPHLWIGNKISAQNSSFIINNNIKYIINLTKKVPNYFYNYTDIKYLTLPIDDDIYTCVDNMNDVFIRTNTFILNALKNKSGILVHCNTGKNISSAIVAAFLIKYLKLDYLTTIIYINSVRKCALTKSSCIINALYKYFQKNL
jgi:protein tyrosine/serine phosphatase